MGFEGSTSRWLIGSASIASVLILIGASIVPHVFVDDSETSNTVDLDDEWDIIIPDDYASIMEAFDHAISGDRIFVRNGTHPVRSRLWRSTSVSKQNITLWGAGSRSTIIDVMGTPLYFSGDAVVLRGFTLRGNNENGSLLVLSYCHDCMVEDVFFDIYDWMDGREYGIKCYGLVNFIFRNNQVCNGEYGLTLDGCQHSLFEQNHFERIDYAVRLDEGYTKDSRLLRPRYITKVLTRNNIFKNNSFFKNYQGIADFYSIENHYIGNIFDSNWGAGLHISNCITCTIEKNSFHNDGLELAGLDEEDYLHTIQDNIVNDKPLYYYVDEYDLTVPADAGCIILIKCSRAQVQGQKIYNTTVGVLLAFCRHCIISENEFGYNDCGVYLMRSYENTIKKNNLIGNTANARFVCTKFVNSHRNNWKQNYWEKPLGIRPLLKRLPVRIPGRIYLERRSLLFNRLRFRLFGIPVGNYDIRPIKTPYSIPVG